MNEDLNRYDSEVEERLQRPLNYIISFPKEERWLNFKKHVAGKEWEEVTDLLARAHWGKSLETLVKAQCEEDFSKGGRAGTEFNAEVWMKSIQKTIEEFEFDDISFMKRLKHNYRWAYSAGKHEWNINSRTGGTSINQSRAVKLSRLMAQYVTALQMVRNEMLEKNEKLVWNTFRPVVRQKLMDEFEWCTKPLLDEVERLYQMKFVNVYPEDEEEGNILDTITYDEESTSFGYSGENSILRWEEIVEARKSFSEKFYNLKEIFQNIKTVEERECFRALLTRDILIELKLEDGAGEDGKEEKFIARIILQKEEVLEKERKNEEEKNKKEKETREIKKHRYCSTPAGNEEVYQVLKNHEFFIMDNFIYPEYIEKAIENSPKDLSKLLGIYYNLLQREFKFADSVIAGLIKLDDSKMSRLVKRYNKMVVKK